MFIVFFKSSNFAILFCSPATKIFETKPKQVGKGEGGFGGRNFYLLAILPKPTQQKIADLVKKSHRARKEAKALFEEAERKVEEMIERGENPTAPF